VILPRREEPVENAIGGWGGQEGDGDETDDSAHKEERHGKETGLADGVLPFGPERIDEEGDPEKGDGRDRRENARSRAPPLVEGGDHDGE